jgi:hypothetical protein
MAGPSTAGTMGIAPTTMAATAAARTTDSADREGIADGGEPDVLRKTRA